MLPNILGLPIFSVDKIISCIILKKLEEQKIIRRNKESKVIDAVYLGRLISHIICFETIISVADSRSIYFWLKISVIAKKSDVFEEGEQFIFFVKSLQHKI